MAGINVAQMVRAVNTANTTKVASSSEESSTTDFAVLIQGKVQKSSEEGKKSEEKVDNQTQDSKEKPVAKKEEKEEKDSAPVQGKGDDTASSEAMLQAAMNQILMQDISEVDVEPVQVTETISVQVTEPMQQIESVQPQQVEPVQPEMTELKAVLLADTSEVPNEAIQEHTALTRQPVKETSNVSDNVRSQKTSVPEKVENTQIHDQVVNRVQPEEREADTFKESESGEEDVNYAETSKAETEQTVVAADTSNVSEVRDIFAEQNAGQEKTVTVRTEPQTFSQDVGNALAKSLPSKDGTLTIELEPASLGKLTIKVVYEAGKAAVSIMASNPKTLDILSQNAGDIARILEEKTGQQTMVYTPDPQQQLQDDQAGREHERQSQDQQEHKKQQETESFTQMLRLGLVV